MPKFSAYLQIYNDASILPAALTSIFGHVDELVVVDGAYEWMVPYLTAIGKDPARSNSQVYTALEQSGISYRAINRVWKNQVEKRIAGYEACEHDLIFRVDADEIFYWDDAALARCLAAGSAVGEMAMPTYLAPGWVVGKSEVEFPRQCFFFDRKQVSAELHLNYLWLVLEADRRPADGVLPFAVYGESLAFNAHLTAWRPADANAARTGYYTTNWMRGHGVPWIRELEGVPQSDFDRLFEIISPRDFEQFLEIDRLCLGKTFLEPGEKIVRSKLSPNLEVQFSEFYKEFLESLKRINELVTGRRQPFALGHPIYLDITTPLSRRALSPVETVPFVFSVAVYEAQAFVCRLSAIPSTFERAPLEVTVDSNRVCVMLPVFAAEGCVLREVLELTVWSHETKEVQHFKIA